MTCFCGIYSFRIVHSPQSTAISQVIKGTKMYRNTMQKSLDNNSGVSSLKEDMRRTRNLNEIGKERICIRGISRLISLEKRRGSVCPVSILLKSDIHNSTITINLRKIYGMDREFEQQTAMLS